MFQDIRENHAVELPLFEQAPVEHLNVRLQDSMKAALGLSGELWQEFDPGDEAIWIRGHQACPKCPIAATYIKNFDSGFGHEIEDI
ncbi:MAG: hypothetical protein P4L96_15615 [Rhodoferax sp.]|nr:hypothetical protein [Rhodoferax sp.]